MNERKAVLRRGARSAVHPRDLIELLRGPAALSVPGDVLVGAAAAGRPVDVRTLGAMASSVCLYWAGMALNDYADAAVDAVERPERPIPSRRVPRRAALALASGLTAAGLGLSVAAGGRRGLVRALPLAAVVWAYDLKLKATPAGPAAMAAARTLDVFMGALPGEPARRASSPVPPGASGPAGQAAPRGGRSAGPMSRHAADRSLWRRAAVPAALIGTHTYTVTALSRHEVAGAPPRLPATTLAVSLTTALAAAGPVPRTASGLLSRTGGATAPRRPGRPAPSAVVASAAVLSYAGAYGSAQVRAVREPSGAHVQRAVTAGILSLIPLQAALAARAGAPAAAAVLGLGHPLARRLARRICPT
ncbi:prenyltransferase [Streptomyces lydicus]|uniref:Prenyltransferase n=1 Tax=Streptomyces lydicus TaxID=47763 RepID=A0A3Q9K8W1_9ACTN|nr:UbiA family prenyltransferase [Streptomyces lydicus]AZS76800.1 prenyltransferase [Streptomyces lydicus]